MHWEVILALTERHSRRLLVREWVHFDIVFLNDGGRMESWRDQAVFYVQVHKSVIYGGRPAIVHGNHQGG